jgi:serine/threonine protein kinase
MTPETWEQIKGVLATALDMAPEERSGYLDQCCGGDTRLRHHVELLLQREQDVDSSFLNETSFAESAAAVLAPEDNPWLGRRVGAYRILEQIGAGGMGEVYRAFRADDQYRKDVALKVVRAGQDSVSVVTRFKNERQILASLEHPNIARLLDGGTAEDGTPYLVMELIEGQPITEYVDSRKLSIPERLKLFMQVCAAVQYAHQRLIIHRDIKPGNILVTADGTPKLLDFGIAKVLGTDLESQPNATLTAFRILTPEYASPEQIKGEPVTTASDVYSLGVILYDLLTGRSPYPVTLRTPQELAAAICQREPDKLSAAVSRVSSQKDLARFSLEAAALARGSSPHKLRKYLSGDLDNIVLMALRKEPFRRYASAEQFAEDIRRHLEQIPVLARKDTTRYRVSKFVARHKASVAVSAALLLALLAGLAFALHEARVARQQAEIARAQRARAERRFNDVRKLATSLMFDIHDRIQDLPGSSSARELLLKNAIEYLDSLASESGSEPSLLRELATGYERIGDLQGHYGYANLGDTRGGLANYEKALSIRAGLANSPSAGPDDQLELAACYRRVAYQRLSIGDTGLASEYIQRAVTGADKLAEMKPSDDKVLYELGFDYEIRGHIEGGNWSAVDLGNVQNARDDYKRAVAIDEAVLKPNPSSRSLNIALINDLIYFGNTLRELGDNEGAANNYRRALQINEQLVFREDIPSTRRMLGAVKDRLAWLCEADGKWQDALRYRRNLVQTYQKLSDADPSNVLAKQDLGTVYVDLGRVFADMGRTDQAISWMNRGIELNEMVAARNTANAEQKGILAQLYVYRGDALAGVMKTGTAKRDYQKALDIYTALSGLSSSNMHAQINIAVCESRLGRLHARQRQAASAIQAYNSALDVLHDDRVRRLSNPEVLFVAAETYSELADVLTTVARSEEGNNDLKREYVRRAESARIQSADIRKQETHRTLVSPYLFSSRVVIDEPRTGLLKAAH